MEYVIKELLHPEEDDEANFIYSELDSQRRETRRVEFYPSGMCFAYGGDMGQDEVLDPAPFPEDLRTLNRPGATETSVSSKIWTKSDVYSTSSCNNIRAMNSNTVNLPCAT